MPAGNNPFTWMKGKLDDKMGVELDAHVRAAGAAVVRLAKQLAPKRTGALEQSIRYTYDASSRTLQFVVGVPYGVFQEYGTYKMAPHPFMRPAILLNGPSFSARVNIDTQFMTALPVDYKPRKVMAHIRPQIGAANKRLNQFNVKKAAVTFRHVAKDGGVLTFTGGNGQKFTVKSSVSKLNRRKTSW